MDDNRSKRSPPVEARFLRSHKIDLAARKSWCESTDPHFTAKAADVVGLYVAPPAKAIVLCVDEKPSIQTGDIRMEWSGCAGRPAEGRR